MSKLPHLVLLHQALDVLDDLVRREERRRVSSGHHWFREKTAHPRSQPFVPHQFQRCVLLAPLPPAPPSPGLHPQVYPHRHKSLQKKRTLPPQCTQPTNVAVPLKLCGRDRDGKTGSATCVSGVPPLFLSRSLSFCSPFLSVSAPFLPISPPRLRDERRTERERAREKERR